LGVAGTLLELLQPSRINQATRINEPRTPSENPRCAICLTPCFKRRCGERITFSPVLSQNLLQLRREPVQAQGGVVHLVLDVHPPDGYGLCCRRPAHPRFGTPLRRFAFARFGAAPLDFHRTPPRGPPPSPLFQRPCLVSIVRRNAILPSPNRIRKNADNRDSVNHTSQRRFPDVMPDDLPGCLATVCVLHLAWLRHSIHERMALGRGRKWVIRQTGVHLHERDVGLYALPATSSLYPARASASASFLRIDICDRDACLAPPPNEVLDQSLLVVPRLLCVAVPREGRDELGQVTA